jgi:hypothetical protein
MLFTTFLFFSIALCPLLLFSLPFFSTFFNLFVPSIPASSLRSFYGLSIYFLSPAVTNRYGSHYSLSSATLSFPTLPVFNLLLILISHRASFQPFFPFLSLFPVGPILISTVPALYLRTRSYNVD